MNSRRLFVSALRKLVQPFISGMAFGPKFLGGIYTIIIIAAFNCLIQLKTRMLMLISAFKARLINTIGTWVLIKAQIIRFYELQELTGVMRLFPNLAPELL